MQPAHTAVTSAPDSTDNTIHPPERWATGIPAIANTVNRTITKMGVVRTVKALSVINQLGGFDCPGCGWPEPPPGERHQLEFCESGAKAVAEEATTARIDREFFTRYSIADLRARSDFWLTTSPGNSCCSESPRV